MTTKKIDVAPGCKNLRQGDIIDLREVMIPGGKIGTGERITTCEGVAIVSQTCDVVQISKSYCLVAPVIENLSDSDKKDAAKGRKPLHLFLDCSDGVERVADLQMAVSIPKTWLEGKYVIGRIPGDASRVNARAVSAKIMRAFGRFPFPDEVHPAFQKFRNKVQKDSGRNGNFAKVLELIADIRISADQWDRPGRNLKLHLIVETKWMASIEDVDPSWQWSPEEIKGAVAAEADDCLTLDRVSELILKNMDAQPEVLNALWVKLEESIQHHLLNTHDDEEVYLFEVEVVSEAEMSLEVYKTTESLDLEVLSHSQA